MSRSPCSGTGRRPAFFEVDHPQRPVMDHFAGRSGSISGGMRPAGGVVDYLACWCRTGWGWLTTGGGSLGPEPFFSLPLPLTFPFPLPSPSQWSSPWSARAAHLAAFLGRDPGRYRVKLSLGGVDRRMVEPAPEPAKCPRNSTATAKATSTETDDRQRKRLRALAGPQRAKLCAAPARPHTSLGPEPFFSFPFPLPLSFPATATSTATRYRTCWCRIAGGQGALSRRLRISS